MCKLDSEKAGTQDNIANEEQWKKSGNSKKCLALLMC